MITVSGLVKSFGKDHEKLVARPRDLFDGALPSSNAVMADVLVRLGELTANSDYSADADRLFAMVEPLVRASPPAEGAASSE